MSDVEKMKRILRGCASFQEDIRRIEEEYGVTIPVKVSAHIEVKNV